MKSSLRILRGFKREIRLFCFTMILGLLAGFLFLEVRSEGLLSSFLFGIPLSKVHHPILIDPSPEIEDYVVVVCMAKGEGRYLREWADHHKT